MLNKDNVRELAYLVTIDAVTPIEGYDRVELAHVGGWTMVVGKGQFVAGDIAVYFEIDSKLPEVEPFTNNDFLAKKHYKVKTQKMCKSVSQGLLMVPADFGWVVRDNEVLEVGGDCSCVIGRVDDETRFLTQRLGITYAVVEDNSRKANSTDDKYKKMAQRHPKLFQNPIIKKIYKTNIGKKILFVFFGKKRDTRNWPEWVQKTDEERVENMSWVLSNKAPMVATEKIDGTSTTFTMKRGKWGKKDFYICSRNVVFDKPDKQCFYDTNVYVEMAEKYNIEKVLNDILDEHPGWDWVTLQGETYGERVQKRDYGLNEHRFAGFNFITSEDGRWDSVRAAKFMTQYNIPWVPILDENYILPDTIEELREFSHSEGSHVDGVIKEGIVFRSQDGSLSFKCVDPEFLMMYHN